MSLLIKCIVFLLLNFGALALGGVLQGEGPSSAWYQSLNIAPWTPPGWVFGAAWTLIMLCFSVYMAYLVNTENSKFIYGLFGLQLLLNIFWNPMFFNWQEVLIALVMISALLLLMVYMMVQYKSAMGWKTLLLLPYVVWLLIATSLNAYVLLNN